MLINFSSPPQDKIGNLIYNILIGEKLAKLWNEKGIPLEIGIGWVKKNLKRFDEDIILGSFQSRLKELNS